MDSIMDCSPANARAGAAEYIMMSARFRNRSMFEINSKRASDSSHPYLLHCVLVVLVIPILGLGDYRATLFVGAFAGWIAANNLEGRSVAYAWVPALLLFSAAAADPIRSWSPSWSQLSHWEYFRNTMFGPQCSESECLYTVFSCILTGGVAYSLAGYVRLAYRSRLRRHTNSTPHAPPE